ncbi:MAG: FtsW/RodA/SpoVE family cell cycle protein, partial [Nodosilinea sp.]
MLNLEWQKRWQFLLEGWQEVDWLLFLLPSLLVGFSSLVLSSIQTTMADTHYALNHLGLGLVCLGLALWIARSRHERLQEWYWIIYGLTNASLVLVMLIGTVGNGAQSWIGVGG